MWYFCIDPVGVRDFTNNYKGNYSNLLSDFSLDYDKSNQSFIILNSEKIKQYSNLYKKCYNTINTDNTIEHNKQNNNNNTNSTNNTKNKKNVLNVLCANDFSKNNSDLIVQEERVIDLTNLIKDNLSESETYLKERIHSSK